MSHKVHPKIFRTCETKDWDSRWFSKKEMPAYLAEDFAVREFIKRRLKDSGIEKVEIERSPGKLNIIIGASRPGLVIGRGGEGIERLKEEIIKKITKKRKKEEIRIEIREIRNPWLKAELVGQWVAQQIERRMPYRRVLKQGMEKLMVNKEIKGARIEIAGRLNGTDIARRDWLGRGRLPLQTLRADIDYSENRAYCTYGVIGIKVWIYKGDRLLEEK